MLRLAEGTLVVLVGPSGSGKTTWADAHFPAESVAGSDRLRAVVGESEHDLAASTEAFAVLDLIVSARVRRRLTTVVDTLGLDTQRRAAWRDLAARHGVPCVAVLFDTPAALCRRRNADRRYRVPAPVLAGQFAAFAQVSEAIAGEGFTDVVRVVPEHEEPVRVVHASMTGRAAVRREAAPDATSTRRSRRLRFGLHLSAFDCPGGAAGLAKRLPAVARTAEDAGFDSLWVMDHFRQIPQVGRPWDDMLDPAVTLGALASATSTIRLGCLVHAVGFRNLGNLAKIVATLDVLSGGRAECGLGAGWHESEYAGYGYPFPPAHERLDLLEDALQVLPMLWGKGSPAFSGKVVSLPETMCYPRPLQDRIPMLVGGSGERRTLRLVAEYADACNLTGDVETVRHKLAVLDQHCAAVGRDPSTVEVTHLSTALVADTAESLAGDLAQYAPARGAARWRRWANPGTVQDHVLRVRALQRAGVDHVIVALVGVWDLDPVVSYGAVIESVKRAVADGDQAS